MKKFYFLFIVCYIALMCNITTHAEDIFKVGLLYDNKPFSYTDRESETLKGFDIEFLAYISENTDIPMEYVQEASGALLRRTENGYYSICTSNIITHKFNMELVKSEQTTVDKEFDIKLSVPYMKCKYIFDGFDGKTEHIKEYCIVFNKGVSDTVINDINSIIEKAKSDGIIENIASKYGIKKSNSSEYDFEYTEVEKISENPDIDLIIFKYSEKADKYVIYWDGHKLEFPKEPYLVENELIMIPLRTYFEKQKMTVEWDEDKRQLNIYDKISGDIYTFTVGSNICIKNGTEYIMADNVEITDNYAFVPIISLSKITGYPISMQFMDGYTNN